MLVKEVVMESKAYSQLGQAEPAEPNEINRLTVQASEIFEQAERTYDRLGKLVARLFGEHDDACDNEKTPEPVRAEIEQLEHILVKTRALCEATYSKVHRLERL